MNNIASFCVDHTKLNKGIYISRVDGDITTYDIRIKCPNSGDLLNNAAIHTIEHLFATYARNSAYANSVIYFGPMGCRTGFYFLLRDSNHEKAIELIRMAFEFISTFDSEIPGVSAAQCGNYLEHDLIGAKQEATAFLTVIKDYNVDMLTY